MGATLVPFTAVIVAVFVPESPTFLIQKVINHYSDIRLTGHRLVSIISDFWCQFHQHFMSSFCAKILSPKNYKAKLYAHKRCAKNFGMKKDACKALVKLTVIPKFFAQLLSAYNLGL